MQGIFKGNNVSRTVNAISSPPYSYLARSVPFPSANENYTLSCDFFASSPARYIRVQISPPLPAHLASKQAKKRFIGYL